MENERPVFKNKLYKPGAGTCPVCGVKFQKTSNVQKYCSENCSKSQKQKPKQMKDEAIKPDTKDHPEAPESFEAKLAKIRATCPAPKPKPEFQRELQ